MAPEQRSQLVLKAHLSMMLILIGYVAIRNLESNDFPSAIDSIRVSALLPTQLE
jgi:hypothetical protein